MKYYHSHIKIVIDLNDVMLCMVGGHGYSTMCFGFTFYECDVLLPSLVVESHK